MVRSISSLSVGLSWTPILTPFLSHINSTFPFLAPSTGFQDPTSCGQSNWTFSYSFPMPCWRLTLTTLRLQILLLDSSSSSLYMSKSESTLYIWLKCLPPPRSLPGCLLSFTTYWFPTLSANVPLRVVAIEIKGLVLAFGKLRVSWEKWTSRQVPPGGRRHRGEEAPIPAYRWRGNTSPGSSFWAVCKDT